MGMVMLRNVVVVLVCAGMMPAWSAGSGFSDVPRLFGTFHPEEGVWSEYAVDEKDTGKKATMRMAVVGKEGNSYWYEVVNTQGDNRNVIKMLVKGDPNDPDNIERMIIKSGDSPAAEMAKDFVAMGRKMAVHMFQRHSGISEDPSSLRLEKGKAHRVTVPAGTFTATPHKIVNGGGEVLATYDFVPEVLPFGVVTSETDTTTMQLLAYGRDAKSVITETPVPMMAPPGMPQGMPRGMPPGMGTNPAPKQ